MRKWLAVVASVALAGALVSDASAQILQRNRCANGQCGTQSSGQREVAQEERVSFKTSAREADVSSRPARSDARVDELAMRVAELTELVERQQRSNVELNRSIAQLLAQRSEPVQPAEPPKKPAALALDDAAITERLAAAVAKQLSTRMVFEIQD